MRLKLLFKLMFFLLSVLFFSVAGIMYIKLSFIDWPYLWGGILFFITSFFLKSKR